MKFRRLLSVLLAVVIVASCAVVAGSLVVTGADTELALTSAYQDMLAKTSDENDYGLAPTVNEGTILQAWNWSFNNIKALLPTLAEQGFTTIQVSPPNEIKAGTKGAKILQSDGKNGWWMFYQPAGFQLNNSSDNALGNKEEFTAMCTEAKKYGIKIIVDAVINHMGTCDNEDSVTSTDPMAHVTPKAAEFEPEIYNNKLFHTPWKEMQYIESNNSYYNSAYDLTRNCTSRLPDLKTEDTRVQNAIYDYLAELIECGASGFRFDAAKHIETPDDHDGLGSSFWTNTLGKVRTNYPDVECYAYGEILNTCGIDRPFSWYTKLFDVTDSGSYWGIKDAATNGGDANATPYYPNTNFTSANTILWDESHDTYMDGATTSLTTIQRGKIWALVAGRSGISCVYFARPDDSTSTSACYNIALGDAKKTAWSNATTKAINQFHNYFIGQSEYCTSNQNGWAYIERGNTGCIIVHRGGATSGNATLTNHKLANGTYKDSLTGNTFTVSGGVIKGSVGSTGVACIYYDGDAPVNPTTDPDQPTVGPTPVGVPSRDGCYTVIFSNGQYWDGSINIYYWDSVSDSGPNGWPGVAMDFYQTNEFGESQYVGFVPVEYDRYIINNGTVQTVDCTISGHIGVYASAADTSGKYTVGTWEITVGQPEDPTDPPVQPTDAPEQPTSAPGGSTKRGDVDGDGDVTIFDASSIQKSLARYDGYPNYEDKTSPEFRVADVDSDGDITIFDASLIQKYLAKYDSAMSLGIGEDL